MPTTDRTTIIRELMLAAQQADTHDKLADELERDIQSAVDAHYYRGRAKGARDLITAIVDALNIDPAELPTD